MPIEKPHSQKDQAPDTKKAPGQESIFSLLIALFFPQNLPSSL